MADVCCWKCCDRDGTEGARMPPKEGEECDVESGQRGTPVWGTLRLIKVWCRCSGLAQFEVGDFGGPSGRNQSGELQRHAVLVGPPGWIGQVAQIPWASRCNGFASLARLFGCVCLSPVEAWLDAMVGFRLCVACAVCVIPHRSRAVKVPSRGAGAVADILERNGWCCVRGSSTVFVASPTVMASST